MRLCVDVVLHLSLHTSKYFRLMLSSFRENPLFKFIHPYVTIFDYDVNSKVVYNVIYQSRILNKNVNSLFINIRKSKIIKKNF